MTPVGKSVVAGVLVMSVILLVALVISNPDGTTVALAVAIGIAVALSTWYQGHRR